MAHFAKRHYEAVASAMQDAHTIGEQHPQSEWHNCVESLGDMFARDSGLFKRDRFIRACQPGANVRART